MSRQLWPLSYGPFVGTRRASLYHTLLALDEALEALGARRVPELPQRLRLDLPDPLARDLEVLADLLERVVALLADAEAHPEHLLLARGERGERSEEHTSELQSRGHLVCRLLLEKKKKIIKQLQSQTKKKNK